MQHQKHEDDYERLIIEKKSSKKVLLDIYEIDYPIQKEKQQQKKEHKKEFLENKYEQNEGLL